MHLSLSTATCDTEWPDLSKQCQQAAGPKESIHLTERQWVNKLANDFLLGSEGQNCNLDTYKLIVYVLPNISSYSKISVLI